MSILIGTDGNDTLTGGAGADTIHGKLGNDILDGGGGDDVLTDTGGVLTTITGGTGNDLIVFSDYTGSGGLLTEYRTSVTIDAGGGNDLVYFNPGRRGSGQVSLGAGNDVLVFADATQSVFHFNAPSISLGTGQDLVRIGYAMGLAFPDTTLVVSDFTAGAGGDAIDLSEYLAGLYSTANPPSVLPAANPFASGHIRLVQSGADTILRIDYDGNGPGTGSVYTRDVLRLSGVTATQLTAANFGGWSPAGGSPQPTSLTGTAQADRLFLGAAGGTLNGQGGDDTLFGSGSGDAINGGDGRDALSGGAGNDTVDGGLGDDVLDGGLGDDILRGGDGNDRITDSGGNDTIEGGAGNDSIVLVRNRVLDASLRYFDTVTIDAGSGDDIVDFLYEGSADVGYRFIETALSVDLGGGDDLFRSGNTYGTTVLTLGAGRDQVELGALVVITDFAAGPAGDEIDIGRSLLGTVGWDGSASPFVTGHLRLLQVGADTLVARDYDGVQGDDSLQILAVLRNVQASALTAENFLGYAPDLSPLTGRTITGTTGNDTLRGTAGDDTINGLDGDDILSGGRGADTNDGGAGNDTIEGGLGSDTLIGGSGDDRLSDTGGGSDNVTGGDGNDAIVIRRDFVPNNEQISVSGGTGDDTLEVAIAEGSGAVSTLTADMGDGNDRVTFLSLPSGGATVTLGAGSDTVVLDITLASQVRTPVVITDFQVGDSGDVLDWLGFMEIFARQWPFTTVYPADGSDPYNPFYTGQARLIQSGTDTLLQMSYDPSSTDFSTLVAFQNTSVSGFTQHNLGIDFALDTVTTTAGNDTFGGTAGRDVVRGGSGSDTLSGLGGADLLVGGAGNDKLSGGDGDDVLYGESGADTINGGAGNDVIDGGLGADTINGDGGDDRLTIDWSDKVTAGSGNDRAYLLFDYYQTMLASGLPIGSLDMGDGDDFVVVRGAVNAAEGGYSYDISLGAGNDRIITDGAFGRLTLGAGSDRIEIGSGPHAGELIVTDFETGAGGDVVALSSFRDSSFDLFALGAVKLVQDGTDVLLTFGPSAFNLGVEQQAIRFLGKTVGQFTPYNLGGYDPTRAATATTVIDTTLTIAAGASKTIVNPSPFASEIAFLYESQSGTGQFVNHGTVTITSSAPFAGGPPIGFATSAYGAITNSARFFNAPDGKFRVQSISGGATGFMGTGLSVRNEGNFEVTGAGEALSFSITTGMDVASQALDSATSVYNSGAIWVAGGSETYGVRLRGAATLDNRGTIEVEGPEFAVGVQIFEARGERFNNSGTITVTSPATSTYYPVGVLFESAFTDATNPAVFRNSGTISAEIAFYSLDVSPSGWSERLINSGLIDGAVFLAEGDDTILNSGEMHGRTLLGDGNDRYDGSTGQHFGSIEGGNGNDTLIGGSGNDTIFGDAQDDVLKGGAGDDYLEGGQGNDLIDGGTGFDTVSYFASPLAIVADLAAGTIFTSQDTDFVRNVEQLVGSRGNDVIRGGNGDDALFGFRGDDVIEGRGGADVLHGGQDNDVLIGGAGADLFVFDAGDGKDEITDFSAGDRIAIHGYASYQSLQQQGADVRIVLSASDSILVRGATAATFNAQNLAFHANSGGYASTKIPDVPDETFFPRSDFIIDAGTRFVLGDTQPLRIRYSTVQSTAIALEAPVGVDGLGVWNAGTIELSTTVEAPYSAAIASSIANGYGGRNHWLVNQAGGELSVTAANSKSIAAYGIAAVWNAGLIQAVSTSEDASAILGLDPAIYGIVPGTFVNVGSIIVDAAGIGRGVDQGTNSGSVVLMVNSGQISVHGGKASHGIENFLAAHPAAEQPAIVNSGSITVTDETPLADSAGLLLNVASRAKVWNSGTITADYAIKVLASSSYQPGGDKSLTVYNSGSLNGAVQLSAYDDILINTSKIAGSVNLGSGNDLYDGRLGTLNGTLDGYDGDDTLLAGAGDQTIVGGFGNDILSGGAGNDTLTGGAGKDRFRFGTGFGIDTITDFAAGERIDVSGYSAYQSLAQQGADVIITFSATDKVIVRNATAASLTGAIAFGVAEIVATTIPSAPVAATAPPAPTFRSTTGTADDNSLIGDSGRDELLGLGGADNLSGLAGDDRLLGGDGNDVLTGGTGDDLLIGGAGKDIAVFQGNHDIYAIEGLSSGDLRVTSKAEGTDLLAEIEILRFADGDFVWNATTETLNATTPSGGAARAFLSDGFSGGIGGAAIVFGTLGPQDYSVLPDAGEVTFDPSFNRGGDVIRLPGSAAGYTIAQLASAAIVTNGTITATIPLGPTGLSLVFADGARTLVYDSAASTAKIGSQAFGGDFVTVTAASSGAIPPVVSSPDVAGRLFMDTAPEITLAGSFKVFGTTGSEHVVYRSGDVTFDASFNRGGDVISLPSLDHFTASRSGSSLILTSALGQVAVPFGQAGMVLDFDGAERLLRFDLGTDSLKLGNQVIDNNAIALG